MKVQHWRREAFRVWLRDGELRKVVGRTRGRFGIFDVTTRVTSGEPNVTWYLVNLATNGSLLAFARLRDARLASEIIADLELDGTDSDRAVDRLQRAGFYITATLDQVGNYVWKLRGDNPEPRQKWAPDAPERTATWLH